MSTKFFSWGRRDKTFELTLAGITDGSDHSLDNDKRGCLDGPRLIRVITTQIRLDRNITDMCQNENKERRRSLIAFANGNGTSPLKSIHRSSHASPGSVAPRESDECFALLARDGPQPCDAVADSQWQIHHVNYQHPATRSRSHTSSGIPDDVLLRTPLAELPGDFVLEQHSTQAVRTSLDKRPAGETPNTCTTTSTNRPWTSSNNTSPFTKTPATANFTPLTAATTTSFTSNARSKSESRGSSFEKEVYLDFREYVAEPPNRHRVHESTQIGACPLAVHPAYARSAVQMSETKLIDQIASMRHSQQAYIATLQAAHERELESHRSYIRILEASRTQMLSLGSTQAQLSANQIQQAHARLQDAAGSSDSTLTVVPSNDCDRPQHRTSQDSTDEIDALRRELSTARRASSEAGIATRERDELRHSTERQGRTISRLRDTIRRSKESEQAWLNAIADLKSRLEHANLERTDVLEGLHEAKSEIGRLKSREQTLLKAPIDAQSSPEAKIVASSDAVQPKLLNPAMKDSAKSSIVGEAENGPTDTDLIEQLNNTIREQNARIAHLEASSKPVESTNALYTRVAELETALSKCKTDLIVANTRCKRYIELYHEAAQRKSRRTYEEQRERSGIQDLPEIRPLAPSKSITKPSLPSDVFITILEAEEKERLDGDVGRKRSESEKRRPTTAPGRSRKRSESVSNQSSKPTRSASRDATRDSGLGITGWTSSKSAAQDGAVDRPLSTKSVSRRKHSAVPSPPEAEKQLPDPPRAVQRGESMRSISESIISSYAKLPPSSHERDWKTSPPTSKFCQTPASASKSSTSSRRRRQDGQRIPHHQSVSDFRTSRG